MEEGKQEIMPKKKKSFIKRFFKFLLYTVLTFIMLNVLIYALLSIPFVQQKVLNFAVNQLKAKLNTEVSIDEVRLRLFNHAILKGIYIEDQAKDTLLYAHYLDVSLSPWELIRNTKLEITSINLDNFILNVTRKDSISDFNFQFVIDAFTPETPKVDTTKSALTVVIKDVNVKNGRIRYDVLSAPRTPEKFNPSHIVLNNVNTHVDLNSIDPDKLNISLNNFSAKEESGFEIKDIKAHLHSDKSQIWLEGLMLKLPNSHLKTDVAKYNLSNHQFEVSTNDTEILPADFTVFMPDLKYLTENFILKTHITGTLPSINVENIALTYGEDLTLEGNASLVNYEKYADSNVDISINNFKITTNGIASFAKLGDSTFVTPDILKNMGDIFLKGTLNGQMSKFKLDLEAWCKQGAVNMSATGYVDSTFTKFDINSDIRTQNMNLSKLIGEDKGLGRLTMNVNLKAHQSNNKNLSAQVRGIINSIQYQKETLRNIPFQAFYNNVKMGLSARADLPVGKIMADIEMTQAKVPDINMLLRVDSLHVERFYENKSWDRPRLSFNLKGHIKGLDIDNITGKVTLDSIDFYDTGFNLEPAPLVLEAGRKESNEKFISFTSGFLSATIVGKYKFTTLSDEFTNLMSNYLPNLFQKKVSIKQGQNDFIFNISAQNTEQLDRIFKMPVNFIAPANISGHINTIDGKIDMKGNIPYIIYNDIAIKNTKMNIENTNSVFNITLGSKVTMGKGFYNLSLNMDGSNNALNSSFYIKSDSTDISVEGGIYALVEFIRNENHELISSVKISPSDIKVKDFNFNILSATIVNKGERTKINNLGVGLNNKRYLGVEGVISNQQTDTLKVYFDQAQIADLLEIFDIKDIYASVNGNIMLTNVTSNPRAYTEDLSISDIVLYKDTLGTISINSQWNEELGGVKLNAALRKTDGILA